MNKYPNFNLTNYLMDIDISYREHDSDGHQEIAVNCCKCVDRGERRPDTKYRCWVNQKNGMFYCYNCGWTGPLEYFVKEFSKVNSGKALQILKGKLLDPMDVLSLRLHEEKFEYDDIADEVKEIELPHGFKSIDGPHPYLKKRGIPWRYAKEMDWGYCELGYCANRIIVPSYMENRLVFWQARDFLESKHEKWGTDEYKKVLNPKGVSAKSVLYNYDTAKKYEHIILVEGFIDAVKVGLNAMATNGKVLHPKQVEWLLRTKAKKITIMWDLDSWKDHRKKNGKIVKKPSILRANDLLKAFFDVRLVKMPSDRDAGDFKVNSSELEDLINSSIKI